MQISLLILFFIFSKVNTFDIKVDELQISNHYDCDFYWAKSTLTFGGNGIFAGRSLKGGYEIDSNSISLTINPDTSYEWSVMNYAYATDYEDHDLIVFGIAMLFNHKPNENYHQLEYIYSKNNDSYYYFTVPTYSTFNSMIYRIKEDYNVSAGDELFTIYSADDSWFVDRGIKLDTKDNNNKTIFRRNINQVKAEGICISDTYFNFSSIPLANKGLFAKRNFTIGELVTISPVLVMSKESVLEQEFETVLLNYCIGSPVGSDLPLAYSAGINHSPLQSSNIEMKWFTWDSDKDKKQAKDYTLDEIKYSNHSQLEIAYYATKEIKEGEEILFYYGSKFELNWQKYQIEKKEYDKYINYIISKHGDINDYRNSMPLFRQEIEAPIGLFPESWEYN